MQLLKKDINFIEASLSYSNYDKTDNRITRESQLRERDPYQRDYSRILYSSSFRRLQGKMQLLAITSMDFHRNRLTHSYEVAQIARSITEHINLNLTDSTLHIPLYVVEAASLAHDIGNPPFGHYGEFILNKISSDIGGFEGNAQTLRVLMNLEKKIPNNEGLNLTLRTLIAVIKYFNKSTESSKFIYDDNYDTILENLIKYDIPLRPRTIEAQIMDISDEIAYAAHDVEDALSQKFFTIDDLLYEFEKSNNYNSAFDPLYKIVESSKAKAKESSNTSSETYNFYFKKELTSNIVYKLINDIGIEKVTKKHSLKTGTDKALELNYKTLGKLAEGLKKLTFNCIKRSDKIQLYEKQGEVIIKKLVDVYMNQNFNKNFDLLPAEYRPEKENINPGSLEQVLKRKVIDYISGMMDSYAIATYEKFYGKDSSLIYFDKQIYVG